jgi:hypothetical protein
VKLIKIKLIIFGRRALALVSGAVLAGGTVAYMQSRYRARARRRESSNHALTPADESVREGLTSRRKKKSGLKSLHILAAILLKRIGQKGTINLFSLAVAAVILFVIDL